MRYCLYRYNIKIVQNCIFIILLLSNMSRQQSIWCNKKNRGQQKNETFWVITFSWRKILFENKNFDWKHVISRRFYYSTPWNIWPDWLMWNFVSSLNYFNLIIIQVFMIFSRILDTSEKNSLKISQERSESRRSLVSGRSFLFQQKCLKYCFKKYF